MTRKVKKLMPFREKALTVLLVCMMLFAGTATALFYNEYMKNKTIKTAEGISTVTFTRTGAVVSLDSKQTVAELTVYDGGNNKVVSQSVGRDVNFVMANFKWTPYEKYRFDVHLQNNNVLSTPGYAPEKPSPFELFTINYTSEFPAADYHLNILEHGELAAESDISADDRYIALGLADGRVSLVDIQEQKEVWVSWLPHYQITQISFSNDDNYIIPTGADPTSMLYVLNAKTGQIAWKYNVTTDIGSDPRSIGDDAPRVFYAGICGNSLIVSATRAWLETSTGEPINDSRDLGQFNTSRFVRTKQMILSFDIASGKKQWTFPQKGSLYDDWGDGTMDRSTGGMTTSGLSCSENGKYVAVGTGDTRFYSKHPASAVFSIDAAEGKLLWEFDMPIMQPYTNIGGCSQPRLSPDGQYLSVNDMDGLFYLFDNLAGQQSGVATPLWRRDVGTPETLNGVGMNTMTLDNRNDGKHFVVYSGPTLFDPNDPVGSTAAHPNAGKIWCYNAAGQLQWTYSDQALFYNQRFNRLGISDNGFFTFSNRQADIEYYPMEITEHPLYLSFPTISRGLWVFDLNAQGSLGSDHLAWFFPMKGAPSDSTGAISKDGTVISIVEAPVNMNYNVGQLTLVGTYQLHVLT